MKILAILTLYSIFLLAVACGNERPTASPTAAPNLEATVQAAVSAALPTETPTPTPDINATVAAGIAATASAAPTPTPTLPPTPDLDATVEVRMAATIAARPAPAPTPVPRDTPTPTATPIPTKSPAALLSEMVKEVRPAVVRIETRSGSGSGAIFEIQERTAYIITNHHVVEGVAQANVTVNDSVSYTGTVLGTDSVRDLAVVRICCGSFSKLAFGDTSSLEPGDEVVAIGYALGLSGQASITRGIVSAIRYDSGHRSDVIQTDAAINPGNSGGPMLSMSGEILGINTYRIDESRSGRTAEGLSFAISETTVQQRIPTLKTAQAAPTPTPTRSPGPTPTPAYGGTDFFGPMDGELWHDPADGFIETEYADMYTANMIVAANFANPYSAGNERHWDYGFMFRDGGLGASSKNLQVVVSSRGRWILSWREGRDSQSETIAEGTLKSFDTRAGGGNRLWVMALGELGLLFVNEDFISTLDLSNIDGPGDVAVITGAFAGNEVAGAVTRYEGFVVVPFQRSYGPAEGQLEYEKGFIGEHESGVWARDIVAESEFTSPPGSKWDYGFIIRNPDYNRLEVIGVNGDNWWFHEARDVGDNEYTDLAQGRLKLNNKNHLLVWAFQDVGMFFVNGEYVARLDLSHNLDYGSVSVMGGFYNGHTGEPDFENFSVWTFPD